MQNGAAFLMQLGRSWAKSAWAGRSPAVVSSQPVNRSVVSKVMPKIKTPPPVTIAPVVVAPVLKEPVFVPTMVQRAQPVPVKPGAFTTTRQVVKIIERKPASLPMPAEIEPEEKTNYWPLILGAGAAAFLMMKQ